MSDVTDGLVRGLQKATGDGRPERILAELREHYPDVLDGVALADVASIATAAEVVVWLDLSRLFRQESRDG